MSAHAIEPHELAELRLRAAARLSGPAAAKGAAAAATDALSVLHTLASSPATAPDALALLHELQVHQVELDLQAQELRESRAELESALRRQIELYESQPVGCFSVDARLALRQMNGTGAEMLGISREEAYGLGLDVFLEADSLRRFRATLVSVDAGVRRAACVLALRAKDGTERQVVASVGADAAASGYLVALLDAAAASA
jgi:PAS domain-containing protein